MNYFNKMINHLSNWFEYAKEHLLRIITILILVSILCYCFTLFPKENIVEKNVLVEQHIIILGITLENWFTYISLVGLLFTAIWAIYQFDKSTSRKQQEKGAEIAQEFASHFIERLRIICDVLIKNPEVKKMVSKISNAELSNFTTLEIERIIGDKNCFNKYTQIIHSKRTHNRYTNLLNKLYTKNEKEKFDSSFPLLVENTLNLLEAICINISSQAAGSEYIYNSLHQSFLKSIEILSVRIAANNNNNVDKYYTHIIQVYNMWNTQKMKDIKKFEKTEKKIKKLNTKAEKEIHKLLEKKNKTV